MHTCPHCGAALRPGADSCKGCGSDAATGWGEQAQGASFELPPNAEDFDYEDFLARELPGAAAPGSGRSGRIRLGIGLVAIGLLLVWSLWR